jgi:hypothetical protein
MAKTVKMQPDKFNQLVKKQDENKRPATLGEPTGVTNWLQHIALGHNIKTYTHIKDTKDPKTGKILKEAYVTKPNPGMRFIAVRENDFGYYYIWIICLQDGTDRIIYRINSGELDFVDWDVPAEKKEDTK